MQRLLLVLTLLLPGVALSSGQLADARMSLKKWGLHTV